jgi:hypothetical protein
MVVVVCAVYGGPAGRCWSVEELFVGRCCHSTTGTSPFRVHGSRQPVAVLMGNTAPSPLVRAIPRRPTAFVGRLHIDTTVDDLTKFLQETRLQGVNCRKLAAQKDRTFRSAAFQVSCDDMSRDLFYCDSTWPEGAELRDWYFKPKSSAQDTQVKLSDSDRYG